MVPVLVSVALDCFRDPLAYRHLQADGLSLPVGFDELLTDLCAAVAPGRADETARLTGVRVQDLQSAARFFVRQMLLPPGADHYRCLGLRPDASAQTVRLHYRLLIGLFHPDRDDALGAADASVAARLNAAYRTLRDDAARRHYDAGLRRSAALERPADPATLFRRRPEAVMDPVAPWVGMRLRPLLSSSRHWLWLIGILTIMIITMLFIAMPRAPELRTRSGVSAPPPVPAYLDDAAQTLLIAPAPPRLAPPPETSSGIRAAAPAAAVTRSTTSSED
jgi:hypothetical protein